MFDFRPDCYIMSSTAMFKGVMAMQSIVSRYVQEQCQMDMFNMRGGYSADTKIFSKSILNRNCFSLG